MSSPPPAAGSANSLREQGRRRGRRGEGPSHLAGPGSRWFSESDPIWRVHADASMFVGGIRALLLQSLHPLAMAGVAGHSGYRSDPWGRLQRTSALPSPRTTFGTADDAEAAVALVRGIHSGSAGRAPDGRPYAASRPAPARLGARRRGRQLPAPHTSGSARPGCPRPSEADRYVAQSGAVAARLGVRRPTADGRRARGHARRPTGPSSTGTPAARDAARFLLLHPPLPLGRHDPGTARLAAGAVALLPAWAKEMLRLPVAAGHRAGRSRCRPARWP